MEKVQEFRAQVEQAEGPQLQKITTASSEVSISPTTWEALEDRLGVATTPGSMPTLMNPFGSATSNGFLDDIGDSSIWNDMFDFGVPEIPESGHSRGIFSDLEDGSNSHPANASQPPNEAVFDPTINDGGHPNFIPAAYGENGVYPNSDGMQASKDFINFVSAPGWEMAQMGDMGLQSGLEHLSSFRTISGTGGRGRSPPRGRSPLPLPAASHFNGGCDPCLRRGLRCSLLDEEQIPCTRCRQLRQVCTVKRSDSSEERTPYRTIIPVANPEPPFQREARSDIFLPEKPNHTGSPLLAVGPSSLPLRFEAHPDYNSPAELPLGIPKLKRTATDVYQDELYNPSLAQQVPKQPSHQQQNLLAPSYQNPLNERLKAANQAHLSATAGAPAKHKSLTSAP
jgi:hypothetical protein